MKSKKPDLVLSGINWGYNLAEDVFLFWHGSCRFGRRGKRGIINSIKSGLQQ